MRRRGCRCVVAVSAASTARTWSVAVVTGAQAAYPQHPARHVVELNPWARSFANGSWSEVEIPDVFLEREVVSYETAVPRVAAGRAALVKFACSLRCVLAADGEPLAENDSPYLPIFAELPAAAQTLRLTVDSRFLGRHNLHQIQYDWLQPGGIFAPVELHLLRGRAHLRRVAVYPLLFPRVRILVDAATAAGADYTGGETPDLAIAVDDRTPVRVLEPGGGAPPPFGRMEMELDVPGARRWSPSSPELHSLAVYLLGAGGQILDAVVTRFGLREVAAREGRVHINGEPVQLLGVNRHHFGPLGVILSEDEIQLDVAHLRNLGGNFLRGAHYPQDPRLLDSCDEEGILVWEEALAWQNTVHELNDPVWMGLLKSHLRRMVEASANHPSVIIFGFLNEGASNHPASVAAYAELANEVRTLDPTRLVGWASSVTTRDLCWEHADVVGFNDYSGWYPTTSPAGVDDLKYVPHVWKFFHDWMVEHFPGKPLIASEFGAGGQKGRRGTSLTKWTEEFQALLVQLHLLGALHADVAGVAIWQLADCPVDPSAGEAYRPNGLNDKGLLTTGREPKLVYGAVRQIFRGHRSLMMPQADMGLLEGLFGKDKEEEETE